MTPYALAPTTEQHDIALVDRHGLVNNAARLIDHRVRADSLLNDVHAFNEDVSFINAGSYRALGALVLTSGNDDFVTFTDTLHRYAP